MPRPRSRTKGPRYTPVSKRQDRPNAIAWLVRNFPELTDGQIGRLVGTTKPTITSVRDRTHWNIANIKAQDPVAIGMISRQDLTTEIEKARRAAERAEKREKKKTQLTKADAPSSSDGPQDDYLRGAQIVDPLAASTDQKV